MSQITIVEIQGELVVDSGVVRRHLAPDEWTQISQLIWGDKIEKIFLNVTDLLAITRCRSLLFPECNISFLIDVAEVMSNGDPAHQWLRMSVVEGISHDMLCRSSEKAVVQDWFEKNYTNYLPEATLVKAYSKDGQRPDCIVDIGGIHYPVECKLNFSKRGTSQLKKYMKIWGVNTGVAVAKKFSTTVPSQVTAILVAS
jgi:hypothetical protein